MLLKRFYFNLFIRIGLILVNMAAQAVAFTNLIGGQLLFTFIVLSGMLLLQLFLLFLYLRKSNRLFTRLVLSISNQDFSFKLRGRDSLPHEKELNLAFNQLIEQFRSVSMEKESQTFLMHHLVRAIPAGIMVIDDNEEILLKNRAINSLLGLTDEESMQQVKHSIPEFYGKFLNPGFSGTGTFIFTSAKEQKRYSVSVSSFRLLNSIHKLVLVQDISKEVEAGEMDAIQRLLRILTHEIMNSLTPVQSLTETITMLMKDENGQPKNMESINQTNYNDILESVDAIRVRTEGLDHFINNFRTITKLPETLQTKPVEVKDLIDSVFRIMHSRLANVEVSITLDREDLNICIDMALMEQVLINLITNSLTAMSETAKPCLKLESYLLETYTVIEVGDNGTGIPGERLNHIFMPFYSTKEKASGIGLSFVKQVLRMQNASIHVRSDLGKGSTFIMKFQD